MNTRVFVVESSPEAFAQWNHWEHGLQAELETMGQGGFQAQVEQIGTAGDLLELAKEVQTSRYLPGRAVIFTGVDESDLARRPIDPMTLVPEIEEPRDYDAELDPRWVWKGDTHRPLSPYGRLLAARLVHRMIPDVRLAPGIQEDEAFVNGNGYFAWAYGGGGYDELVTNYGAFLTGANRQALATGKDHMSLVDAIGEPIHWSITDCIEGTDVDARYPYSSGVSPEIYAYPDRRGAPIHYIGVAARLLADIDPPTSRGDAELVIPRLTDEAA